MDAVTLYTYKPKYRITRWFSLLAYAILAAVFIPMFADYSGSLQGTIIPGLALAIFIAQPFLLVLTELMDSPRRIEFSTETVRVHRFVYPPREVPCKAVFFEKGIRLKMGKTSLHLAKVKNAVELTAIVDDLASRKIIAQGNAEKMKLKTTILLALGIALLAVVLILIPSKYVIVLFMLLVVGIEIYQAVNIVRAFMRKA